MSLRIRRGIESQRSSVVLDTGEIAWTTDTKKLYVGDGVTSGGVHVLANSVDSTSGLAWDNTTQKIKYTGALENALQNLVEDISPELGGNLNLNNKTINGTGTINFTGNISATALSLTTGLTANLPLNSQDITGTGNINITGTITSSGTITANGGLLVTGLGGVQGDFYVGTGVGPAANLIVTGNTSIAGTLTATTGLGADLSLNGRSITGTGSISFLGNLSARGNITAGSTTIDGSLIVYSRNSAFTQLNSLAADSQFLEMQVSNGTFAAPTAVASQDILGGIILRGYTGSMFERAVIIAGQADGVPVGGGVPGKFVVYTTDAAGTGLNALTFDKAGKLTVPSISVGDGTAGAPSILFGTDASTDTGFFHPGDGIVCVSTNGTEKVRVDSGGMRVAGFMKVADVAGTLPNPPEAGMIVLDGSTFKGYNGSAWVDLN